MRKMFRSVVGILVAGALLLAGMPPARAQGRGAPVTVIRDAETETLLRSIANPLFRAAGVAPGMVQIIVIRDDALNSFVSTGNRMFINSGIILACRTVDELVGVIAHETGHIRGGHLAKLPEMMRQAMFSSLAALLIGAAAGLAGSGDAAAGLAMGGQQLAQRSILSFTRGMEQSADQAAVATLDRLHWSARGMLELFQRLSQDEALYSDMKDPYILTHPLTSDRIAFVKAHVAQSPWSDAPLPAEFAPAFAMVKAKMQGFLEPSSQTLARVKASDTSAPARYARAVALYRLGHTDEAVALIDGLLRQLPASPWLHELKGQVLFEGGRPQQAIAPYREAVRLAPGQPLIRAALGRALIETGRAADLRPAVEQLSTALAADREEPGDWHALGVAYGRLGDLPNADLALAEEALLRDDVKGARALAGRAAKSLPPGPARQRALDIANAVSKENRPDN